MKSSSPELRKSFANAIRGKCPHCGIGKLLSNWFRVNPRCDACDRSFPVGEGAFLGSMAINYTLVVFLVLPLWLALWKWIDVSPIVLLYGAVVIAMVTPVLLYPLAWSLWIWVSCNFLGEDDIE